MVESVTHGLLSSRTVVGESTYFTSKRGWELAKVAALCSSSVSGLAAAGAASAPLPPVAVVLVVGAALGLAGCVAFSAVVLLSPDDRSLDQAMKASDYVGPGIFLAPIGAVIDGEDGLKIAVGVGNVTVGGLGIGDALEKNGLPFLLSANPDKGLFLDEVRKLIESLPLDFDRNYFDSDRNAFEPGYGYDIDTNSPPGMGDVSGPGYGGGGDLSG